MTGSTTDERPPGTGRPLSVSQHKTYERCSYGYYLERIEGVWQRPAAWLSQGTAFHEAAEAYERSGRAMTVPEMQEVFRESYAHETNKMADETPNLAYWFSSGPYAGPQDIERRYGIGLEQVERYPAWYEKHPNEVIWIDPDGEPGIELGFVVDLDGITVRGFIDAVILDETTGRMRVRDNKSGNQPGDDFQLGTYSAALAVKYGIEQPSIGDYWMARTGKPTFDYDLAEWTVDRVTEEFHQLAANIEAARFIPDPEPSKCRFCSVASSCEFSM
ncbi:PD-(D/E)XK nuclease family protein [Nocardia ninae]|uniref:PD-(D/E)XK endonuclease-like domain-containing protein n=1 Tax=Nocardia ninae NBRC 108245 TaxID=1210091 RepID=A0A511MJQ9_9NOCA|nr:PD-(D/E)XK nuclease family protein [Nocardia ninae]GEM40880.1 hypothetical protein NN4_53990 [Nocardia ninae NBRC 108245]